MFAPGNCFFSIPGAKRTAGAPGKRVLVLPGDEEFRVADEDGVRGGGGGVGRVHQVGAVDADEAGAEDARTC